MGLGFRVPGACGLGPPVYSALIGAFRAESRGAGRCAQEAPGGAPKRPYVLRGDAQGKSERCFESPAQLTALLWWQQRSQLVVVTTARP